MSDVTGGVGGNGLGGRRARRGKGECSVGTIRCLRLRHQLFQKGDKKVSQVLKCIGFRITVQRRGQNATRIM